MSGHDFAHQVSCYRHAAEWVLFLTQPIDGFGLFSATLDIIRNGLWRDLLPQNTEWQSMQTHKSALIANNGHAFSPQPSSTGLHTRSECPQRPEIGSNTFLLAICSVLSQTKIISMFSFYIFKFFSLVSKLQGNVLDQVFESPSTQILVS